jgi:hypothetical protein
MPTASASDNWVFMSWKCDTFQRYVDFALFIPHVPGILKLSYDWHWIWVEIDCEVRTFRFCYHCVSYLQRVYFYENCCRQLKKINQNQ